MVSEPGYPAVRRDGIGLPIFGQHRSDLSLGLCPEVDQVLHRVTQALTTKLKLGHWPVVWPCYRGAGCTPCVGEPRLGIQHVKHVLRIGYPVSREVKISTLPNQVSEVANKFRLNQTALVVSFLCQGSGKKI